MDIINQMLHDYSGKPTCDTWVVVIFAFILHLTAVNARTILKYKKESYTDSKQPI